MAKKEKKVTMGSVEQALIERLNELDPESDEYRKVAQNLATLKEAEGKVCRKVSPDTWVKAGVSLGSVLLLLAYERNNPITSKLLSKLPGMKL